MYNIIYYTSFNIYSIILEMYSLSFYYNIIIGTWKGHWRT